MTMVLRQERQEITDNIIQIYKGMKNQPMNKKQIQSHYYNDYNAFLNMNLLSKIVKEMYDDNKLIVVFEGSRFTDYKLAEGVIQ